MRDPRRVGAERDAGRRRAERERLRDGECAGIDPLQRLVEGPDPERAAAGGDRARPHADRHEARDVVRPGVDDRERVRWDRDGRLLAQEDGGCDQGGHGEHAERSGEDPQAPPSLRQFLACLRGRNRPAERRILIEHRPLERLQVRPRLEPEAVHEVLARRAVRGERVGLPAGAVEREHHLGPERLVVRVLDDETVQLGQQLGVAPEREVGVDSLLERAEAELLELCDRRRRERLAAELGERPAAPQRQGAVEELRLARAVGRRARFGAQALEAVEVERPRLHVEHVAGGCRP